MSSITNRHAAFSDKNQVIEYEAPVSLSSRTSVASTLSSFEPDPNCSDQCTICWELLTKEPCAGIISCSHKYHRRCIEECLNRHPKCPICRQPIGAPQGPCPSGTMVIHLSHNQCPGYDPDTRAIQIEYEMPMGTQGSYHESPGRRYFPTYRMAFLPDTDEGRHLLSRLKYAWTRGLLFTIGTSLTTGMTGAIVWTSVHHKTSLWGGPYSFPDPNYIANCNGSLDALYVPSPDTCLQRLHISNPDDENEDEVAPPEEQIPYLAPKSLSSAPAVVAALLPIRPEDVPNDCSICLEPHDDTSVAVAGCNHAFHRRCIESCLDRDLSCPVCRRIVGDRLQGRCPSGVMKVRTIVGTGVPGFACQDAVLVEYVVPPGKQRSYHPNPGEQFDGDVRIAVLPKDEEGGRLLKRLKFAWTHGLVFTVGTSMASGRHNTLVWAGIPHKTSVHGGEHGYPDNEYFDKCNGVLDGLGVPKVD